MQTLTWGQLFYLAIIAFQTKYKNAITLGLKLKFVKCNSPPLEKVLHPYTRSFNFWRLTPWGYHNEPTLVIAATKKSSMWTWDSTWIAIIAPVMCCQKPWSTAHLLEKGNAPNSCTAEVLGLFTVLSLQVPSTTQAQVGWLADRWQVNNKYYMGKQRLQM